MKKMFLEEMFEYCSHRCARPGVSVVWPCAYVVKCRNVFVSNLSFRWFCLWNRTHLFTFKSFLKVLDMCAKSLSEMKCGYLPGSGEPLAVGRFHTFPSAVVSPRKNSVYQTLSKHKYFNEKYKFLWRWCCKLRYNSDNLNFSYLNSFRIVKSEMLIFLSFLYFMLFILPFSCSGKYLTFSFSMIYFN